MNDNKVVQESDSRNNASLNSKGVFLGNKQNFELPLQYTKYEFNNIFELCMSKVK
jgi:hypothetical protein